jgi:hypothetical protein
MKKTFRATGTAALLALALAAPAGAVTVNQGLTAGVLNTVEDQNREAYVDANGDGLISVGDVFVGFVRIDDFGPSGLSAGNQVYVIFSNQIVGQGADPTIIQLGTTTVAGLTLADITGDANTAGGMFAVYDNGVPFTTNLISDSAPGATSIKDDNDLILAEGTLRLVAGLFAADNFFTVDNLVLGIGSPNASLASTPVSVPIGSFTGGLNISFNNTNFAFADSVVTFDPITGFQTVQVGVANGGIRGAIGDGEESVFTNIAGYGAFTQCAPNSVRCGTTTDADFFVAPSRVPEPATLALFGAALLAGFGFRRKANDA